MNKYRSFLFTSFLAISAVAAFSLSVLLGTALAQDALAIPDPGTIIGYVCAHQSVATYVMVALFGHTGFSFLSAGLKKLGITTETVNSPLGKFLISMIRAAAIDMKPPNATVVAQAEVLKAADPTLAAQADTITQKLAGGTP